MNDRITARIAEVRALFGNAREMWEVIGDKEHGKDWRYVQVRGTVPGFKWHIADVRYVETDGYSERDEAYARAAFIAASRELVPALLNVIQELRFQLHQAMWKQWENAEHKLAAEDQWEEKIADLLDGKSKGKGGVV